ncbi:hypothetical protein HG530_003740 [Fusarium avenaceum]|nr:hypothetical protein HG530_003740 [Fusarium avenaceum]
MHNMVFLDFDERFLFTDRKGLFTTVADYRIGVTDKHIRCFRGKGGRHTAVIRLWNIALVADSEAVEDRDSIVSDASSATLLALFSPLKTTLEALINNGGSTGHAVAGGLDDFRSLLLNRLGNRCDVVFQLLLNLKSLRCSLLNGLREAGGRIVVFSWGLFVSFSCRKSLLGGELHGVTIKILFGSSRGNLHALILNSCGGILGLKKSWMCDNQLLELLSPLVERGLELVVLGPVLVSDSISPGPPHPNLLQGEVSSLVQDLEMNIGNSDHSLLELFVIRLAPLADGLSLLLDGHTRRSYRGNDLFVYFSTVFVGSSER